MHSQHSTGTKSLFLISAFLFVILCLKGTGNYFVPGKYKGVRPGSRVEKPSICGRFHLITMYFTGAKVSDNLGSSKYKNVSSFIMHQHNFTDTQLGNRHREYMEVLQSNLNHPCVEKVHLFYVKDDDLETVLSANLTNSPKLHPVKRERALHMADFFVYASKHLLKKPVIALNGDIALGEGFHKININKLLNLRLMYSLTRHEKNISCSVKRQMCPFKYRGSHDTHVFALAKPLNETLLMSILDYPINMYQAENGMIYTMRNTFNFKVTNPCMALKTYHHHCSTVHGPLNHSYSLKSLGWNVRHVQSGVSKPVHITV